MGLILDPFCLHNYWGQFLQKMYVKCFLIYILKKWTLTIKRTYILAIMEQNYLQLNLFQQSKVYKLQCSIFITYLTLLNRVRTFYSVRPRFALWFTVRGFCAGKGLTALAFVFSFLVRVWPSNGKFFRNQVLTAVEETFGKIL